MPLNPTIIMQGDPNFLMCFLDGSLHHIEHHIIPLAPNYPRKTTPQEKLDAVELFICLAQKLIKEVMHHKKGFLQAKVPSFDKELPHDVGNIQTLSIVHDSCLCYTNSPSHQPKPYGLQLTCFLLLESPS